MQHDRFESGNNLDLRSNFTVDLSRPTYISYDVTGREKDVIVTIGLLPFSSREVIAGKRFRTFSMICILFGP